MRPKTSISVHAQCCELKESSMLGQLPPLPEMRSKAIFIQVEEAVSTKLTALSVDALISWGAIWGFIVCAAQARRLWMLAVAIY